MRISPAIAMLIALTAAAPAAYGSEQPITDLVIDVGDSAEPNQATPTPAILYINGCFDGGCRLSDGGESSISNKSSLLKGDAHVGSYSFGRAHFSQVVRCVQDVYAPFGVTVTEQDPGNVPHFETIVAGSPTQLGFPAEVGGVAPFACDGVDNAISFVFPVKLDGDAQRICETIAHESAHPLGLEHTFLCEDTMTYLEDCGDKGFVDLEAPCGEDGTRDCKCGGRTQNSYRKLIDAVGAANPTPPSLELVHPRPGSALAPGFTVNATATDNVFIRAVELWIDGELVRTKFEPPYDFDTPNLPTGLHLVQVLARDDVWTQTKESAQILVGQLCGSDSDCGDLQICGGGVCLSGPGVYGGLGTACEYNSECETRMCMDGSAGQRSCVMPCGMGSGGCPTDFECQEDGGEPVCALAEGGGCQAGAQSGSSGTFFIFLLALVVLASRRRQA